MNDLKRVKKLALKLISKPYFDMKKYYKFGRKFINFINPPKEEIYKMLDHKIIVDDREIPVRVFIPSKNPIPKLLIFFHGGGWVIGNIDSYTNMCANMANETCHTVVSVDYRLAPENPFPAGLDDCYHVVQDICTHPQIFNIDPENITLIGDSAGGNLAAAVSLMAKNKGGFLPSKQILIYPATNYEHTTSSPYASVIDNGTDYFMTSKRIQDYMELYVPNTKDRLSPYVAPLLAKDLSNQPKTLIITAEYDPLRDEGEAYGEKLKSFGNYAIIYRIKDALHGFMTNPLANEDIDKSYEYINMFLNNNAF